MILTPGWRVVDERAAGKGVHVLPDGRRFPAPDHALRTDCWCRPRLIRDNWFDDPVISHRDAAHPGSSDRADA